MMKKANRKALGFIVPAFAAAVVVASTVSAADVYAETPDTETPVFEISTKDANPIENIKEAAITQRASTDANIDLNQIDIEKSTIDTGTLNLSQKGLQTVTLNISLANKDDGASSVGIGYSFSTKATIKVSLDSAPKLVLSSSSITVNNGDSFNPESAIVYVHDDSNILPAIKIESNVDTSVDGNYSVTYTAVDLTGNSKSETLSVTVATPQEVIDQQNADAEAAAQAEADAEAQAKAEEEAKKKAEEEAIAQQAVGGSIDAYAYSGENPYSGGWGNCTWSAWTLLYSYRGIMMPNLGNATQWYGNAAALGYAVGQTPAAGSIAVYYGHVAYVLGVNADGTVNIEEGGFNGGHNVRTVSAYGTGSKGLVGYIYF